MNNLEILNQYRFRIEDQLNNRALGRAVDVDSLCEVGLELVRRLVKDLDQLDWYENKCGENYEKISELEGKVTELEEKYQELQTATDEKISDLEGCLTQNAGEWAEARIANLEREVGKLRAELAATIKPKRTRVKG